jgi:hypothetical protein
MHALAKALALGYGNNSTLVDLQLNMNLISDEGGSDLFTHLQQNITLSSLDVSANLLGNKTLKAISKLVSTNTTVGLHKLILCCNQFTANSKEKEESRIDNYSKNLAEAVSVNKTLVSVDLRSTDIQPEYVSAIINYCKE